MIGLPELVGEFASTYKEWHYLVVGFTAGVLVGFVVRAFLDAYTRL